MTRTRTVRLVALPVVLATLLLVGLAFGEHVSPDACGFVPHNIAEAAAVGNAAEVVRRLRLGEDPRRVYPIRPDVISSAVRYATGLEAAVWARRLELIHLLDREGVMADAATRDHLACLASDLRLPDVVQDLQRAGAPACISGEAYQQVLDRSKTSSQ